MASLPRIWRRREGASAFDWPVGAAAVALLLLTAFSWLGFAFWLPELLTHFRIQFLTAAVVLLVLAGILRHPASTLAALLVAAASAWPLLPYLLPGAIDAQAGEASTRILFANVRFNNQNYDALRRLVELENPDVVGLAEVDDGWLEALSTLQSEYPHRVLHPDIDANGLALFSRFPVRELQVSPYIQGGMQAALIVDLEMPQATVSFYLAHPKSPTTPGSAAMRNVQLQELSRMIRADRNREQILIGDLNITPWSPHYASLEMDGKLTNAAIGRGYRPTWPAWTPGASFLRIPIDHCLLSEGLRVQNFRTGGKIGSDHLPLIVDIAIPSQRLSWMKPVPTE